MLCRPVSSESQRSEIGCFAFLLVWLEPKLAKFIIVTAQFFLCQTFHWIASQRTALKSSFASSVITWRTSVFCLKVRVHRGPMKVKNYLITSWFNNSILSPVQNIKVHNVFSPRSLSRVLNIVSSTQVSMCLQLMEYLIWLWLTQPRSTSAKGLGTRAVGTPSLPLITFFS